MPAIIIPRKWTQQPQYPVQIDWNNQLSDGLRFAIIMQGGFAYDAATGKICSVSGTITSRGMRDALAADFDSSDYFSIPHDDRFNILNELTLLWRGVIDTGGAYRHFAGKHEGGGAYNNPFDFRTNNEATPALVLVRSRGSGNVWSGPNVVLGALKNYSVSEGANISIAPTFYLDGEGSVGTGGGSGDTSALDNTEPLLIGRRADGAVQMDGASSLLLGYAREQNQGWHKQMAVAPWQIFKRDPQRLYFDVSTGLPTLTSIAASNITSSGARLTVN